MSGERYISDGTWFDEGTEVYLIYGYPGCSFALFEGLRDGCPDEEVCDWKEFIVLGTSSD